jgi:hypothetical protein
MDEEALYICNGINNLSVLKWSVRHHVISLARGTQRQAIESDDWDDGQTTTIQVGKMICFHSWSVLLSKQRRSKDSHGRKSKSIHGNARANTNTNAPERIRRQK